VPTNEAQDDRSGRNRWDTPQDDCKGRMRNDSSVAGALGVQAEERRNQIRDSDRASRERDEENHSGDSETEHSGGSGYAVVGEINANDPTKTDEFSQEKGAKREKN